MRGIILIVLVVLMRDFAVGCPWIEFRDEHPIMKPQRCLRHFTEVCAETQLTAEIEKAETPSALRGEFMEQGGEPVLKDSVKADTLVALAKSQLGKNYCYAVSDPDKGFDCSGFVYYVFNSFKIEVPRSSKLYKNFGQKIEMDSARVGDVIVFTGTNAKKRSPGHVGIVLSCENGIPTFIHSSSGKKKGVIISDFNESPYYKKRFIKIIRVAIVY